VSGLSMGRLEAVVKKAKPEQKLPMGVDVVIP
jgi:hypothetical protein